MMKMTIAIRLSLAGIAVTAAASFTGAQETTRLIRSWDYPLGEPDDASFEPSISADGRFVAFASRACNLITPCAVSTGLANIYVFDRETATTTQVSVGMGGGPADGDCGTPSISDDGRYVAFWSDATNLVPGDADGHRDVFVRDRLLGTTIRVSVGAGGGEADGASERPSVAADGACVVYQSSATNLVLDDGSPTVDVFLTDLQTLVTERISVNDLGLGGDDDSSVPDISADGNFVVFASKAHNLDGGAPGDEEDVFLRDRTSQTTVLVSKRFDGTACQFGSTGPTISDDGQFICYYGLDEFVVASPADGPGSWDAFVYDRPTGVTELVSLTSQNVLRTNGNLWHAAISPDGRNVAWVSDATDMVEGDTNGVPDIFLRDLDAGTTERLSKDSWGGQADGMSDADRTAMSAGAKFAVFSSWATNLSSCDGNGVVDVYLRDRLKLAGWEDLHHALAGVSGEPLLVGSGQTVGGMLVTLTLSNARPGSTAYLVIGASKLDAPFKGGVLVPFPDFVVDVPTFALGGFVATLDWPSGLPCGVNVYFQCWIIDPAGIAGFSASNAVSATAL